MLHKWHFYHLRVQELRLHYLHDHDVHPGGRALKLLVHAAASASAKGYAGWPEDVLHLLWVLGSNVHQLLLRLAVAAVVHVNPLDHFSRSVRLFPRRLGLREVGDAGQEQAAHRYPGSHGGSAGDRRRIHSPAGGVYGQGAWRRPETTRAGLGRVGGARQGFMAAAKTRTLAESKPNKSTQKERTPSGNVLKMTNPPQKVNKNHSIKYLKNVM